MDFVYFFEWVRKVFFFKLNFLFFHIFRCPIRFPKMEVAGIKFAPLHVPWERRLQTFTAFCFMTFLVTGGILGWVIWFALIYYSEWLRYPMLLYGAWILYDKDAGELGGRRWLFFNCFIINKLCLLETRLKLSLTLFRAVACDGENGSWGYDKPINFRISRL